ncbi:MAG: hypothetical protein US48_C0039G0010 [Candidatus Levybacteria bacterium GW2011_GWA2_37_36]|nr:MAG: hypothetical protein US48_C0039G0010 [Candidatus Levybacteria bacterium GW2011_GWA2_37_36]
MPVILAVGGFVLVMAIFAKDTPEESFPVPAKAFPSIAVNAFAAPLLGKSKAVMERFGAHQSPYPPAPKVTSPPAVFVTIVPDFVPTSKSAAVVWVKELFSK